MRVCFLAYRDWALLSIKDIISKCDIEVVDIIKSEEEYKDRVLVYPDKYVDCIILIGWSWIIKDDTLKRFLCVGMHPSDLPMFRGGSPIQHQIIAGLDKTKISLMTISSDGIDVGDIWLKEDWDLSGSSMQEILVSLSESTTKLICSFCSSFDDIVPQKQDLSAGTYYKRRKPSDSMITWNELSQMKLRDVYNLIRALGDPYPNLYVEDKEGNRLLFKQVQFIQENNQEVINDGKK